MSDSKSIVPLRSGVATAEDPAESRMPAVGQWYDVGEGSAAWLGCVVALGSNYVELRGPSPDHGDSSYHKRVHLDAFWHKCRREPDAEALIAERVSKHRHRVEQLLGRVREITAGLAVPVQAALPGMQTQALVLQTESRPIAEYKDALVLAQKETLPAIFKEVEEENKLMASWMKAGLIPLQAEADGLHGSIRAIEQRVFHVELYAGLVEQVERVRDGAPGPSDAKLHLMQRRCYMDEECLAQYEAGGMDYQGIADFDAWLARRENLDRILPHPKTIVAFRVRRNSKHQEAVDLHDFFRIAGEDALDKQTFLYIRNGEQLFRLSTGIEFDEKLFPDLEHHLMDRGALWARVDFARVEEVLTHAEYQGRIEDARGLFAKKMAEAAKLPEADRWMAFDWDMYNVDTVEDYLVRRFDGYVPFTPETVYYDDIRQHVQKQIDQHNRLVLVLQGLLDRSPALHPHPPVRLWEEDGFHTAIQLVYDDSRALSAGERPDFEAYRARLNESIETGSVTVGQEDAWERREAERENARRDRNPSWRRERGRSLTRFRPDDDPGPGLLARVGRYAPRARTCTYEWERTSRSWKRDRPRGPIACSLTVPTSAVLHVSAYRPGDFRVFFADPRTRAEYLRWAPLLLVAEDYHAGKRKLNP